MSTRDLSQTEKADAYDWLAEEIRAREPALERILLASASSYNGRPLQALLRAFDIANDENKRYRLDAPALRPRRMKPIYARTREDS